MTERRKILVAPSVLSADFSKLAEEIRDVEKGGADLIHVDVMDGHFVPNITIGPLGVKAMRQATKLPLDVHLMIDEPVRYVEEFIQAGADWITIHVEASKDTLGTLQAIRKRGVKAGISLRPQTPAKAIEPYLGLVDLVLVMTVEPGFGGQSFMEGVVPKIAEIRAHFPGDIAVDGGINPGTGWKVAGAGANILVAGTSVFGLKDRAKAIRELREEAMKPS
ncbi:MAG: ribulose-phosphate 3-epimerase [Candidatus Omnitrophota bacterium]